MRPYGDLESIQIEIRQEMAATLHRIGDRLEGYVRRLQELGGEAPSWPANELARRSTEYFELREQAKLYRWYLEVQREAMGLRDHAVLDHYYPIPETPAVIRKKSRLR